MIFRSEKVVTMCDVAYCSRPVDRIRVDGLWMMRLCEAHAYARSIGNYVDINSDEGIARQVFLKLVKG